MASVPTRARTATQGMRRISPPSFPRLRSPVAWSTEPVARNSRLLKKAWLSEWMRAALSASAAKSRRSKARKRIARPIPQKIIPTFSIEE